MNTAEVIERLESEGVSLVLTPSGGLDVSGNKEAVGRVLPFLRNHKAEIVELLDRIAPTIQENVPGLVWCQDHLGELLAAGWTEAQLFKKSWPLGLAWLRVWDKATAIMEPGGLVVFTIQGHGRTVRQVARPDNKTIH